MAENGIKRVTALATALTSPGTHLSGRVLRFALLLRPVDVSSTAAFDGGKFLDSALGRACAWQRGQVTANVDPQSSQNLATA